MGYPSSIHLPFLLGVLRSPEARPPTRVGWFGFFWRSPNQTAALMPRAPGFHPQNPLKRSRNGTVLGKEEAAGHTSPPSLQGAAKHRSGPLLPGHPSLTHLPEPPKLQALLRGRQKLSSSSSSSSFSSSSCLTPAEPPPQGFGIYEVAPVHHPQGHPSSLGAPRGTPPPSLPHPWWTRHPQVFMPEKGKSPRAATKGFQ